MNQDFSKRISIVVDKNLPSWQVLNAVAHISAHFGNKLEKDFGTGDYFTTSDAINLPRNSQYPIIVLAADSSEKLGEFARRVRNENVKIMFFFKEMIETTDDNEIVSILSNKKEEELEYLAVGIFGTHEEVKALTKEFKLWS